MKIPLKTQVKRMAMEAALRETAIRNLRKELDKSKCDVKAFQEVVANSTKDRCNIPCNDGKEASRKLQPGKDAMPSTWSDNAVKFTEKEAIDITRDWRSANPQVVENFKKLSVNMTESVAQEAERLVNGPKRAEYGDPIKSLVSIASRWSVILGITITPEKFCECMVELKMNRECAKAKRDNLTDAIGYVILWRKYVEWRELEKDLIR